MEGEVMYVTIHGGWLVFLALAAGWAVLMVSHRLRTLNALLDAAREESAVAQAALAAIEEGRHGLASHVELNQLAVAIGSERPKRSAAAPEQR